MEETREAMRMTVVAVNNGYFEKSGRARAGNLTKSSKTIHTPANAIIPKTPASIAHANKGAETGFARNSRCRLAEVLRGGPPPLRSLHSSHRRKPLAATAQGIFGLIRRLAINKPVHTPPGNTAIRNDIAAKPSARRIVNVIGLTRPR